MNNLVSAVIAILIVMTTSIIVMNTASTVVEMDKPMQTFNEAKYTMSNIHSVIDELMSEATGARRSMNIKVNGEFIAAGDENRIKYKLYNSLLKPGTRIEEDNMQIISGPTMRAYEKDINNDGTSDLVLENDFVLFAIKKIDGTLNTSDMITLIRNKDLSIDVVPRSAVMIDDMHNTSYGTGYTELTQQGYDLSSSSIRIRMNSAGGIAYEAVFTLEAGSDFVTMEVKL
jgi:hypothetical protein